MRIRLKILVLALTVIEAYLLYAWFNRQESQQDLDVEFAESPSTTVAPRAKLTTIVEEITFPKDTDLFAPGRGKTLMAQGEESQNAETEQPKLELRGICILEEGATAVIVDASEKSDKKSGFYQIGDVVAGTFRLDRFDDEGVILKSGNDIMTLTLPHGRKNSAMLEIVQDDGMVRQTREE